ncbi:hypothetical protein NDU88_003158 [Pleurodeles waltl]|uniref:Uncharacterized protein n=1 Tax=Pleurodeles waltl TaxID=8319 RepID=A0AAV7LKS2_PLEWA|nr:hypothetical protein NDU88_003158 [Pleurodeles waltl]
MTNGLLTSLAMKQASERDLHPPEQPRPAGGSPGVAELSQESAPGMRGIRQFGLPAAAARFCSPLYPILSEPPPGPTSAPVTDSSQKPSHLACIKR